jgi:hypothetical protein
MYRAIGNCTYDLDIPPPVQVDTPMEIIISNDNKVYNVNSPEVWGNALWFTLHLGSISAPEQIPPEKREKYWGFIDGIPEMLACKKCAVHAREWVEAHRPQKDQICSSRQNLVKFYVDMHNSVNQRNGQPIMSVEEVYRKFSGPVKIKIFNYN